MSLQSLVESASAATKALSVNELGGLVDHLGDGTFEALRDEPWYQQIAQLVPADIDAESIHALWVVLIDIHEQRYMASR